MDEQLISDPGLICPEDRAQQQEGSSSNDEQNESGSQEIDAENTHEDKQMIKDAGGDEDAEGGQGADSEDDADISTITLNANNPKYAGRSPSVCTLPNCIHSTGIFGDKWRLKRHIDTTHLDLRPHICELCSSAFGEPSGLTKHKRLPHPYLCPTPGCTKSFLKSSLLVPHLTLHAKPSYICPKCQRDFISTRGLISRYKSGSCMKTQDRQNAILQEANQERADQDKIDQDKTDQDKTDQEKADQEEADQEKTDQEKTDQENAQPEKAEQKGPEQATPDQEPEKTGTTNNGNSWKEMAGAWGEAVRESIKEIGPTISDWVVNTTKESVKAAAVAWFTAWRANAKIQANGDVTGPTGS